MHVPADKYHKLDAKAIEVIFIRYKPRSKGYQLWDKYTCSVQLSRDVTFDKSSFLSLSGNEPCPVSTPLVILVIAVSNMTAMLPQQDPSPAVSDSSEEEVGEMLDSKDHPDQQPITPLLYESELLVIPQQCRSTPASLPPCTSAMCIANHPVSLDLQLLGGFNECIQRAQLLCKMDHAPQQSVQVQVPNLRYFNLDNVATGH